MLCVKFGAVYREQNVTREDWPQSHTKHGSLSSDLRGQSPKMPSQLHVLSNYERRNVSRKVSDRITGRKRDNLVTPLTRFRRTVGSQYSKAFGTGIVNVSPYCSVHSTVVG